MISEVKKKRSIYLKLADTLELSSVFSTDASVSTGGVITNPQVALLLRQIYNRDTNKGRRSNKMTDRQTMSRQINTYNTSTGISSKF